MKLWFYEEITHVSDIMDGIPERVGFVLFGVFIFHWEFLEK